MALVIRAKTISSQRAGSSGQASIVDASWEIVDPNPDVHALFLHFNDEFFHGALAGCEVRWSPRMTYCAGLCVYEGRGGLCSVRLSEPLLKFRPRKDLIETLLHEMIHAYLFVSAGDRDRDGHGPQFQAHMKRINESTGANITIYHSFNAEVDFHRQHWWRCVGSCRDRPPYFGYVKRACNRPPGPNDKWHEEHRRTCGGQFEKIKEPEGFSSKKQKKDVASASGPPSSSKKPGQKTKSSDRFPGKGRVLGDVSKIRRLDEFFGKSTAPTQGTTGKPAYAKSPATTQGPSDNPVDVKPTAAVQTNDPDDVHCPICQRSVKATDINSHLDECLTLDASSDNTADHADAIQIE